MPQFSYKAKSEDGNVVTGILQADTEKNAVDSLGRMGMFPMEVSQEGKTMGKSAPRRVSRKIRKADIAMFTRQLGDLLKAGVAIDRALVTLKEQTSNEKLCGIIGEIQKDVLAGKPFHEAFGQHPQVFGSLFVSMVKAGETGGFLEDVLHRLAGFIDKDEELKSRIRSALAYPTLLMTIGFLAITFLMIFFIPRFSEIFDKMGGNLPLPTQIIMAISYFLKDYWFAFLAGILAMIAGLKHFSETTGGRAWLDMVQLRIPLFGEIVRKNAVSRFTRTLGTLLRSGVPILSALQIARDAMVNVVLMSDIDEAAAGVKQGRTMAELLRESHSFPRMVIDMIAVGEEGGNLDEVLINVADTYDLQVDRSVRTFVSLFEPALLLLMACVVGFIVISMLLPVFTLSSMVK